MKLKNKKTGEIIEFDKAWLVNNDNTCMLVNSLAELNEDWEDYEEPKDINYWYVDDLGKIQFSSELLDETNKQPNNIMIRKINGNYFETREEAERAVEKLKAWKRLKEARFKFTDFCYNLNETSSSLISADGKICFEMMCYEDFTEDLDLLFGGEE